MVIKGQFQTGQLALDRGISDLMVLEQNGKSVLYATSGQNGGLVAYELAPNGSVSILDTALYNSGWADAALDTMSLVEVNGALCIAVAGSGADQLRLYDVNSDGSIGGAQRLSGLSSEFSQLRDVSQMNGQTLFMADATSGTISAYSIDANGALSQTMQVADTAETYAGQVMAIASTTVKNTEYVIAASEGEKGVSVYKVNGNTLVNKGNAGVNEGLGIMTPTDMEVVEMGGRTFVLLASAPSDGIGQSGAITVMELARDGSLVDTDHLIDTAATHFGNIQSLEIVEADGRTYVIAGGGDDGLTLFVLLPNGRLQVLGTVSGDPGLQNITSVAAHFENDTLHLYVASEAEGGVTEITVDMSDHGDIIVAKHGGQTVNGTGKNDILIGGAGNDSIAGGAGDDILEDGLGIDTLRGGNGSDTFVLRSDFTHDVVQDFEAGLDKLDLSAWPMLYDTASIGYTATATGALLSWRGETLELLSRDGQTLSFAQVEDAILKTADRVPDFTNYGGNEGDQRIEGTAIDDAINAGRGSDTVDSFAGNDYIDVAAGADRVRAGGGNDTILLGNGWDYAEGGHGNDRILGGGGRDKILGGKNADTIFGGDGFDTLRGGLGHDLIRGNNGNDTIFGDNARDTLYGGYGNDLIRGGNGRDSILGGPGHDRLFGANGEDSIFGGSGNDKIWGGARADLLDGQRGNDNLVGGGGFDTLIGGRGDDTMEGNFNADLFVFEDGHGNDVIVDFEATSKAEKLEFTHLSMINSLADVMARSVQQGNDVFIDTGEGSSLLLENVLLSDLDVSDFIF